MTGLALRLLRHRPGSVVATLIALAVGVMILTSTGSLVESGLRYRPESRRYAGADIIVAQRDITFTYKELGDTSRATVRLPEGGTVPLTLVDRIRQVPGVDHVVADQSIPAAVVVAGGSRPVVGHSWTAAALAPYQIVAGSNPRGRDQVVVSTGEGFKPGHQIVLVVAGVTHRYTVSGVAETTSDQDDPVLFFTEQEAAVLAPHPGRADVLAVSEAPDADRAAVLRAVEKLATVESAKAYTGTGRGLVERSDLAAARSLLLEVGAAFGGYVVLLIIFVVAGTVGLSIRNRRRVLALLRATGATPRQLRRMLMVEAAALAAVGSLVGVPAGLLASRWVGGQLVARGFLPVDYPLAIGTLAAAGAVLIIVLLATVAALLAARRISAIRPVEALSETAVERSQPGKVRLGFGLATLVGAASSSAVSVGAGGQAALAGASSMLYLFVIAVALLAPWINTAAARALAPMLRLAWGNSGFLAARNLAANARGMATVLTALVLAVGLGGSVWFLQDNLEHETVQQVGSGTSAQYALIAPAGISGDAIKELRTTPGVEGVTGMRRTSVVVKSFDGAEAVPALAIDPAEAGATIDLDVKSGDLQALGRDSVAVSATRAASQGWKIGKTVALWLGDGTPKQFRVVAIYGRGLGFGDVVVSTETAGLPAGEVLVRAAPGSEAALSATAARIPGTTLVPVSELGSSVAEDLAISAWLNKLLIGVMIGYAALSAGNTMIMAALARRREVAVLRLTGVTGRQVRRMVNAEQAGLLSVSLVLGGSIALVALTAVMRAVTGTVALHIPVAGWLAVIGGAGLLAMTMTVVPIAWLVRKSPPAQAANRG
ncbi:FtsX-like permease family protein [Kribbella sp. NPDC048928]|uniref:FtsX-like permease family protein n=1 Tax=Kribbella sp. NPDC048928 TaxID=3364111 RepID=UPI003722CAA1